MSVRKAYSLSQRLFVSNLPWTVGQKEFSDYFAQFGPVVRHHVVFDKSSGMSRKYGFVQFLNEEAINALNQQKTHKLEGNTLNIQLSEGENNGRGAPQTLDLDEDNL